MSSTASARSSASARHSIPALRALVREKRGSELAFRCVNSGLTFLQRLRTRTQNPYSIRQGNTPLCGPAAFLYCVARHFPDAYERYALQLVLYGEARLGDMLVTPSDACRRATSGISEEYHNISPLDWVTLASLRDSTNNFLRMNGPGSNAAGITMPGAMVAWFESSGLFGQVDNHTVLTRSASHDNLLRANQKFRSGFDVCMLIRASIIGSVGGELNMDKLRKETPKTIAPTPDHWVVQTSDMLLDNCVAPYPLMTCPAEVRDCRLDFSVHSWGINDGPRRLNDRVQQMTPNLFLPYYNGFVCAWPKDA